MYFVYILRCKKGIFFDYILIDYKELCSRKHLICLERIRNIKIIFLKLTHCCSLIAKLRAMTRNILLFCSWYFLLAAYII